MIRSVRPMMGTFVEVAVEGAAQDTADTMIRTAFGTLAQVESLLSSHREDSDISRLNGSAAGQAVRVHPLTYRVLGVALALSRESDGAFDVTTGGELVRRGALPAPAGAPAPGMEGAWHDVELLPCQRVQFRRPLTVDLGGIGKGYAVDCAIEGLALPRGTSVLVNAGGDLRWTGPRELMVRLDAPASAAGMPAPPAAVEIGAGALASSDFRAVRARDRTPSSGELVVPRGHVAAIAPAFVTVTAPTCAVADALTKIVQIRGDRCAALLASHGARVWYLDGAEWRVVRTPSVGYTTCTARSAPPCRVSKEAP